MELTDQIIKLRPFKETDSKRLAELCNNRKIWDNLTDLIPFPYNENHATEFIARCQLEAPQTTFLIEFGDEIAGIIGLIQQTNIYRLTAEVGYWIGEPFWGRGIATRAVRLITGYGFQKLHLIRIYAGVFDYNKASQRVLEKASYKLDCVLEKSIIKNRNLYNEYRYGIVNEDFTSIL
jgi:RimJ/RimL family protein N-acetyltransferase